MSQPAKRIDTIRRVEVSLKRLKEVQRLAFGMVLIDPMPDHVAANRRLASYLNNTVQIDDDTQDFAYQVNRRRSSLVLPQWKVNRMCKWSVISAQTIQFMMTPAGPVPTQMMSPESIACRLELDINTQPGIPIDDIKGKESALFNEVADLGLEILQKGDVS